MWAPGLSRSLGSSSKRKGNEMNPQVLTSLGQDHADELHRRAARERSRGPAGARVGAVAPRPARRAILRAWRHASPAAASSVGAQSSPSLSDSLAGRPTAEAVDGLRRGRVRGRQDPPARRADQRRRGARTRRVLGGACIELGEDELPYAPLVAALRPLQRAGDPVLDELPDVTRAELARLIPELGEPPGRAGDRARRGPAAPLRRLPRADRDPRRRAAGAAVDRGHPLGGPLDPRRSCASSRPT